MGLTTERVQVADAVLGLRVGTSDGVAGDTARAFAVVTVLGATHAILVQFRLAPIIAAALTAVVRTTHAILVQFQLAPPIAAALTAVFGTTLAIVLAVAFAIPAGWTWRV